MGRLFFYPIIFNMFDFLIWRTIDIDEMICGQFKLIESNYINRKSEFSWFIRYFDLDLFLILFVIFNLYNVFGKF